MATPAEILAKSKELFDAGDVEGAKRLARIAKDRMAAPTESPAMAEGRAKLSAMTRNPEVQPRSTGQALYDNLIGDPNDGVDSTGERLGRTINDVAKASGAGVLRGTAALADLPGMAVNAYSNLVGRGLEATGMVSPEIAQEVQRGISAMSPSGDGTMMRSAMEAATGGGSEYQAKTTAGEYAGTIAEFLPGAMALGPKTVAGAIKYAVAPGVASETAGQATEGTKAEPWARLVAALAAPMVLSGIQAGSRAAAGLPRSAADPERLKLAKVLDDFNVPVTAGQRTGATKLRRIEGATGTADDVMAAQADDFTAAALKTIGVDANRATPEVLARAADDIGKVFDEVVQGADVVPTADNLRASAAAIQKYKLEAPKATVVPLVGNIHSEMVKAFRSGNAISASTLKEWRSSLSRMTTSQDGPTRAAAQDLMQVVDDAMDAALTAAGRPQDIARLATARGQWRNLLAIEGAAAKAGESAALGVISPARLASEVTRQGKAAWARGRRGDIGDLSRAGVAVMSPLPTVSPGGVRSIEGLSRMGGAAVGASSGAAMGSPTLAAIGSVAGYAAPGVMNWLRAGPLQGIIANAGTREGARVLDPRLLGIVAPGNQNALARP
jgi:hypothetical protein